MDTEGDLSSFAHGDYERILADYLNQHSLYWLTLTLNAPGSNQTVDTAYCIECLTKVVSYIVN